MREFIGMILGCVLTIGIVYLHDVNASSSVANSTAGVATRQIVNWDVAQASWNNMAENVRHAWIKLKENVKT